MNSKDIADIRKTLDTIERMTGKADAKSKMEVLAMLGKTSQSVIAMAKKITEPKTKTRTKVVTQYKDKPQQLQAEPIQTKTDNPPETTTDKPATPFQSVQPHPPFSPLSMQQNTDNESQ